MEGNVESKKFNMTIERDVGDVTTLANPDIVAQIQKMSEQEMKDK